MSNARRPHTFAASTVVVREASISPSAGYADPKGLTIKSELDEYYGSEINHGRLYPNLDTLVEKELVEKSKKDDRTIRDYLRKLERNDLSSAEGSTRNRTYRRRLHRQP